MHMFKTMKRKNLFLKWIINNKETTKFCNVNTLNIDTLKLKSEIYFNFKYVFFVLYILFNKSYKKQNYENYKTFHDILFYSMPYVLLSFVV